jgi:hypothetical protein
MNDKIQFKLTEDHVKLIRQMNVDYDDYCEFGAPEIDPKRPYGNSYVYGDIGQILGIKPNDGFRDDPEFGDDQRDYMLKIHKETAEALQVILASGSFSTGIYEADKYCRNWAAI